VRERANGLKFTSEAAKRDFLGQANVKDFQLDGETLIGYNEFFDKYKAENPTAFVEEKPADPPADPPAPKPNIVLPGNSGGTPGANKSLAEMMKAKNANPDLVVSFTK